MSGPSFNIQGNMPHTSQLCVSCTCSPDSHTQWNKPPIDWDMSDAYLQRSYQLVVGVVHLYTYHNWSWSFHEILCQNLALGHLSRDRQVAALAYISFDRSDLVQLTSSTDTSMPYDNLSKHIEAQYKKEFLLAESYGGSLTSNQGQGICKTRF